MKAGFLQWCQTHWGGWTSLIVLEMFTSTLVVCLCFWISCTQCSLPLQVLRNADRLLSKEKTAVIIMMAAEDFSDQSMSEVINYSPVTVLMMASNIENEKNILKINEMVKWNDQKSIVLVNNKEEASVYLQMLIDSSTSSGSLVTFVLPAHLRSQVPTKRLDTRIILFDFNTTHVTLQELFAMVSGKEMICSLATLDLEGSQGMKIPEKNLIERRSAALNGETVHALKALHMQSPDGKEQRECLYKGERRYHPYQPTMMVVEFVESLKDTLNFSLTLTIMCDMEKHMASNLSIYEQLFWEINEQNDTEFIMDSLVLLTHRKSFADFSPVQTQQLYLFTFHHANPKRFGVHGYLNSFDSSLWLAILAIMIALGLTIALCDHLQSQATDACSFLWQCAGAIWTMLSLLIQQQPQGLVTNERGSRFISIRNNVFLLGSFLSFLFFSLYSSTLISNLTVELSKRHPMNDLSFFLDEDTTLIVNFQGGLDKFHGLRANGSIWGQVGERMSSEKNVISDVNRAEEFLKETQKSAWISSLSHVASHYWKEKPVILLPKEFTTPFIYLSIAMRKRSQLKPIFDIFLRKYEECGLLQKSTNKWMLKKPTERTSVEKPRTLSMQDVSLPFLIITTGVLVTLLLLLFELFFYWQEMFKERRRSIYHVNAPIQLP